MSALSAISVQADVQASDKISVAGEVRHVDQEVAASTAVGATLGAVRVGYDISESTNLYGIVQQTLGSDDGYADNDLYSLGVRAALSDTWGVTAEANTGTPRCSSPALRGLTPPTMVVP